MNQEEIILQKFDTFENGSKFISENFQNLQKNYGDKFIAVKEDKILFNSDSFETLLEKLKKFQLNDIIIQFIPVKGEIILY
ncbi:MAG: hypothetical protein PHQ66_02070 [Candidatus Nanoarchaeia archaeon]|nr:hypothetical protein [Candidatus Nanoarchaeia archaeon]MDD5357841.1 hypothetical protein [Candidatus Nanoarchaeia archaeon]MDD5588760.1 hypothetical protein [Candidatus Nanoarchaeia archaeon]